ncbi:regulatory protein RecX [Actinomadura viridis]|uniref:regulatory protein RecX n=1 Tax=Actinomadura viridis TaxID=58110 RepID=UPI0036B28C6B
MAGVSVAGERPEGEEVDGSGARARKPRKGAGGRGSGRSGKRSGPAGAWKAQGDPWAGERDGESRTDERPGRRRPRRETPEPGAAPEARGEPSRRDEGADPEGRAREICLRLLGMGPRTRAQLAEALRRKEIPDEVAERVLGRFTDVGLIDDEAFAQAWVQSRHAGRGLARRALAAELRRRGVAEETVSDAVETLDGDQEEQTARRLIARKAAATRGVEPAKRTRRLVGVLARKGYPPGLAYRVVREVLEEEGADVEDLPEGIDPD